MFLILMWLNLGLHQISSCSFFGKSHEQELIVAVQTRAEPGNRQLALQIPGAMLDASELPEYVVFFPAAVESPAWWHTCLVALHTEHANRDIEWGINRLPIYPLTFFFFFFLLIVESITWILLFSSLTSPSPLPSSPRSLSSSFQHHPWWHLTLPRAQRAWGSAGVISWMKIVIPPACPSSFQPPVSAVCIKLLESFTLQWPFTFAWCYGPVTFLTASPSF